VVQKFYRGMLHSIVVFDQGIPIRILSENTCLEAYFQKNNTTFESNIYFQKLDMVQ